MTSSQGKQLAALIMADPTTAIPLLKLLNAFKESRGDPLGEVMMEEVMLHVFTKVERCRDAMCEFLTEDDDESNPIPRAA